jgi:GDP/UDP-N,N'-diacetylbacillosamine 2-epimerase (hydrolysing)
MRKAKALVGNSSMGLLEAPFYKLPVVNIGNRQKGRLNAGNVKFVDYDKQDISKTIFDACFDKEYREMVRELKNPFGDGNTAIKVLKILKGIDMNDKRWLTKKHIF